MKHYDDPKEFIEHLNDMQDVSKYIEEYNLGKKRKVLIVFDDTVADMISYKKLNPIVVELYILNYQKKLDYTVRTILSWKLEK